MTDVSNRFGDLIGSAFWLASKSPDHRNRSVQAVAEVVVAGIRTGNYRLWRQDGAPLAFAVWGEFDAEREAKFRSGQTLAEEDFASGKNAWLVELICPFLPRDKVISEIRQSNFQNRVLSILP